VVHQTCSLRPNLKPGRRHVRRFEYGADHAPAQQQVHDGMATGTGQAMRPVAMWRKGREVGSVSGRTQCCDECGRGHPPHHSVRHCRLRLCRPFALTVSTLVARPGSLVVVSIRSSAGRRIRSGSSRPSGPRCWSARNRSSRRTEPHRWLALCWSRSGHKAGCRNR